MKRSQISVLSGAFAALLIAAVLSVGCKPSGEGSGDEKSGASALELGAEALNGEDWARAYDKFSDAIAADDKNVDAYYGRAAAAGAIAEGHYRLAQAATTNQDAKTGLAEAEKADEYFNKLKDDCKKIVELDPKYSDAYFLLGVAAQYQGAWEDGIEAFSECIKYDAANGEAYHRRGEIYDNIGDYMNSSVDFKKASELGYNDGNAAEAVSEDDFSDLDHSADELEDETQTAE